MMVRRLEPLSRRALIRGAGSAAIALPLLDAMIPESIIGSAAAQAAQKKVMPSNRLAILYYPNGIHTPAWYPKTGENSANYSLVGTSAEALERQPTGDLTSGMVIFVD